MQRVTKKWVKDQKQRMMDRITWMCNLPEDALIRGIEEKITPGIEATGTREEMLAQALKWSLEEFFPSIMLD